MCRCRWRAFVAAATAAKSIQSCPTLCDPIDGSPPGPSVHGIFQARTLERVAISFSNAWKWKVKVKSLSHVRLLATPWLQPTRPLRPWDFPGKSTGVGCHCLLCSPSQPLATTMLLCVSMNLITFGALYKWNHMVFVLLWQAYLT